MDLNNGTSKFLSKIIGIYLIIISMAMLINMHQFASHVNNLITDAPLMFVTGFFTLIFGIIMVVSHNVWQWNWRVMVTIVAWVVLFKGLYLIFYPQLINKMTILFIQNASFSYTATAIDFVLGLLFSYFGFRRD